MDAFENLDGRKVIVSQFVDRDCESAGRCSLRVLTQTGRLLSQFDACGRPAKISLSADRKSLMACGQGHVLPQAGPPSSKSVEQSGHFRHGKKGTWYAIFRDGTIEVEYDDPKVPFALQSATVFRGRMLPDGAVPGTAFLFKEGCQPAGYVVTGRFDMKRGRLLLAGAAPVQPGSTCEVRGFDPASRNATLLFVDSDEGDI
ncbi:MAG: hypothetical protein ABWX70_10595 [Hyphomicrobium sp.]